METQPSKQSNYCEICKKIIHGGRTYAHSSKREHLKVLIAKFKKAKAMEKY